MGADRKLKLDFPTFHPRASRWSATDLPVGRRDPRADRAVPDPPSTATTAHPARASATSSSSTRQGKLLKDIVLGEDDMYHPGGMDFDGRKVWVPVAQYRPTAARSSTPSTRTLEVHGAVPRRDHIGGSCRPHDGTSSATAGDPGSSPVEQSKRTRARRPGQPQPLHRLPGLRVRRPAQDALRGRHQPAQTPLRGTAATFELGGLALTDLARPTIVHEVPFQKWSTAGHPRPATRSSSPQPATTHAWARTGQR